MDKLKELREKREALLLKMQALLDTAANESRDLTDDEDKEYKAHEAETEKVKADIARREKLAVEFQEARASGGGGAPMFLPDVRIRASGDREREWRNIGDFVAALRFNRQDPRLTDVEYVQFPAESRTGQSMGIGSEGGYVLPAQFRQEIWEVTPQGAIFRPRCDVIPAGDPPDAALTMPALAQGAGQNMYGGMTVYAIGEADSITETDLKFREFTLTPHQFAALIPITNKLLANWQAAGTFIKNKMQAAKVAYEDTQFYKGNGVAKPKGILNQSAKITVTRAGAGAIASADIDGMYARAKLGGSLVWIASQTTLPQLVTLKNSNNWNLFVTDYTKPVPNTLMGIPLIFNDRSVALGTSGDIVLADLSYYQIKDGAGPFLDVSEHYYFTSAKTLIRLIWATDGNSPLSEAIPLEGSTSNTVSPFVVLS